MRALDTWLIVLNWNGREDTLELLEGLVHEPATILVVDNGSGDGTVEAVHARYPDVRTLQTGSNLGYAGGNNAGIAVALEAGADVIGVLNNDTLVTPGFLTPLLAEIERGEVAVSPDIRYADAPESSWFRGSFIHERQGWPQHLPPGRQPTADGPPFTSPVLTGCCIVASAATWQRVGYFDDGMFLIFEDSDWSRRAAALGVELLVVPRSQILHKVSRSFTGTASLLSNYYFARNGVVFAARHLGRRAAWRFAVTQVVRPNARRLFTPQRRAAGISFLGLIAAVRHRTGPVRGLALRWATHRPPCN